MSDLGGNGGRVKESAEAKAPASAVSRLPAQLYAARMRARERWRRLSVTVTVMLALLAVAGYLIVWHTSVLALDTVRVVGQKTVPAQQVVAAAGLRVGSPLASADLTGARDRVQRIPQIAAADVSRDWPHTVVISIVERTAAALVPNGGGYDVVDAGGVVFGRTVSALPGLTVIQVQGGADVKAAVVPGALAALKALPPDIAHRVTGITASSPYSITLRLSGGVTVDWGGGDDASAKAQDLAALMRVRKAARYDVSAPEAPAMS
ncbi:MAG TPA: FtsQ-type POTRA domain-containing protein [Actinocrinis sp.]|nr:FtsQ-type POTRA domain-containing protein [Actinocrinis sp.]